MASATSAMLALLLAIITSSVAIYLIRTRPMHESLDSESNDSQSDHFTSHCAETWSSWHPDDFLNFLSSFLLPEELQVVRSMTAFIIDDANNGNIANIDECGWRNKHRIIMATGVPQRIIYSKMGIIERLLKLDMIQIRESKSGWGKQKFHYRINPYNEFMSAFLNSLRESRVSK